MCFPFFQTNLFLIPFPTDRQQLLLLYWCDSTPFRLHHILQNILFLGIEKTDSKLLQTVHAPSPYDQAYFDELAEDIKQYSAAIETGDQTPMFRDKFQRTIETECRTLLGDEGLFASLKEQNYDLAIVDHYYNCGFVAATKLNLKYIVLECSSSISLLLDIPGATSPLSYVPAFSSGLTGLLSSF